MKVSEIKNFDRNDWPYTAVTTSGEFHVFKSRAAKRRWQKKNGVTGANNPLHTAQPGFKLQ